MAFSTWRSWLRSLAPRATRHAAPRRRPRARRPCVEELEVRLTPNTDIWAGMGTPVAGVYNWNVAANWSGGVPKAGDDLIFPADAPAASLANNNNLSGAVFNSIRVDGPGYVLSGNAVSVGNVTVTNPTTGTSSDTIGFDLILPSPGTGFFTTNAGTTLTFNGQLHGAASTQFLKQGTGTLALTKDDTATFTGSVTVSDGILSVQNAGALGSGTAGATVSSGATLQLQFSSAATATVGGPLALAGSGFNGQGALQSVSGRNTTFTGAVTLTSDTTIEVDTGSEVTLSNSVGDATGTTNALTKTGAGELVLQAADTYGGNTVVSAGVLDIQNGGALGATSAGTTVNAGAALQVDGGTAGISVAEPLILNGTGISNTGALRNVSGNNTWTGSILANTAAVDIGADANTTLTVESVISEASPGTTVSKEGTGRLVLTQPTNSSSGYTGATTIDAGALQITDPAALNSSGDVTVKSGGALELNFTALGAPQTVSGVLLTLNGQGPGSTGALHDLTQVGSGRYDIWSDSITLNSSSAIGVDGGTYLEVTGNIGGASTATLSKVDNGVLALPSANNYAGPTQINGGYLLMGDAGALGGASGGAVSVSSGATLALYGNISVAGQALTLTGTGDAGSAGALLDLPGSSDGWGGGITLADNATVNVPTNTDTLTLSGPISQAVSGRSLTFNGLGTLVLSGGAGTSNTYTGATTDNEGTLRLEKNGGAVTAIAVAGSLVVGDGTHTATAREVFSNQIADAAAVTVNGNATFDLNNRFDAIGALTVTDGTVTTGTGQLPVASLSMTGGTVNIGNAAGRVTLAAGGVTATSDSTGTAAIRGPGTLDLGGGTQNFDVSSSGKQSIDLTVGAIVANGALDKTDTGVLQLTASNTYAGGTTVGGGRLQVDGTVGDVSLAGGTLGGTGTVGSITSAMAGGAVAPGDSPGILTATGNVSWNAATTFKVDINGLTPGNNVNNYDQLNVTGTVDLGGATLTGSLGNGFTPNIGDPFTVLTSTGGFLPGGSPDNFGNPVSGSTDKFVLGGVEFQTSFNTGASPQTLVLTRVKGDTQTKITTDLPDPSTFGDQVLLAATVKPIAGVNGVPTGNVTFMDGMTSLGSAPLVNIGGVATATLLTSPTQLRGGMHTLTAVYDGSDPLFNGSTSAGVTQTVNPHGTMVMITGATVGGSAATSSTFGQAVTFTATVTPTVMDSSNGNVEPTGSVTFYDGATQLGSQALSDSGGTATAVFTTSTPLLHGGSDTITAKYSPGSDLNFSGNTSANFGFTVNPASSMTVITQTAVAGVPATSSTFGQAVTITATVTPSVAGVAPTGTVTFSDTVGGVTSTLNSTSTLTPDGTGGYTASITTTATQLGGGSHSFTATYGGNNDFAMSPTASGTGFTVNAAADGVAVTSFSPNSPTFGQNVMITATLTPSVAGVAPVGTLTFNDDFGGTTTPLGSTSTFTPDGTGGYTASITTTSAPQGGVHSISVSYAGDPNFQDNTSSPQTLTVATAGSQTAITSVSPGSITFGQTVTITATLTPSVTGVTPGGSIVFTAGGQTIGTVTSSNFVAAAGGTFTATLMMAAGVPGGTPTSLKATYSGDPNFSSSFGTGSVTVLPAPCQTSLTSVMPSPATYGQPVTLTATLTPSVPGVAPIGTVTFTADSTTTLGSTTTFTPAAGGTYTATIQTTPTLLGGNHSLTATYSGDNDFQGGTSSPGVMLSVGTAIIGTALTSVSPSPPTYGQQATITATLTPPAGGVAPVGTVTFTDGGNTLGSTMTITPGPGGTYTASILTGATQLPGGNNNLTAQYSGDTNYGMSSGGASISVTPVPTTTVLNSTLLSAVYGQPVITATVAPALAAAGTPPGTVTFTVNNGTTTADVKVGLVGNTATLPGPLPAGNYTISATYNGDISFQGSPTTMSLTQAVNPASTSTGLSVSVGTFTVGQPVTLTATVSAVAPVVGPATGGVTFFDGSTNLGSASLNNGSASLSAVLTIGPHSLRAVYAGDANHTGGSAFASTTGLPTVFTAALTRNHGQTTVHVQNANGTPRFSFTPYPRSFHGGVQVVLADINGDGFPDAIVLSASGPAQMLEVWDGRTGNLLYEFRVAPRNFKGGLFLTVGDLTGTGRQDILVVKGPSILGFDGPTGRPLFQLTPFGTGIKGPVLLAVGDFTGNHRPKIAAGNGGSLAIFDGLTLQQLPLALFDPSLVEALLGSLN